MKTYAGIDLHSRNNFIGVIDTKDNRLYSKRHNNRIEDVISVLDPFKTNLQGIVVESTYNWYWLVDGLQEHGFKVHLANPSAIKVYEGLKNTDDKWDSFWLAHLLRLGILPEGYIYPKQLRPIRDLLRRRLLFVRQRTAQILSLQSMITRNCGLTISGAKIKKMNDEFIEELFTDRYLIFTAKKNLETILFLDQEVSSQIKLKSQFHKLLTTPGIGNILGLTILIRLYR